MIYDAIIIGLGAMGSAAAYQLSKRKAKVLGLDRFSPPHKLGSTHGETRVTRKAIGEGSEYSPLAIRSYEIFQEIEAETHADLLTITGGIIISNIGGNAALHGNRSFIEETIKAAEKFNVKYQKLTADEISKSFPQFRLDGDEIGYYENDMGFLRPENCVKSQLESAEKQGAVIKRNEKVLSFNTSPDGVEIVTDKGKYAAEKLIVSAGAWAKDFVPESLQNLFRVFRQIFYWVDIKENYSDFKLGNFPLFIWEFGRWENDFFYGFPAIDGETGGIKIATETYFDTCDADAVNREVTADDFTETFERYVENRLIGAEKKCLKTATCLYTVLPKSKFLIDHLPENKRVIVASPCSGHGFKHSAAIGEILAEMITEGKSRLDVSEFKFEKFLK